jgi:hypothetical protein
MIAKSQVCGVRFDTGTMYTDSEMEALDAQYMLQARAEMFAGEYQNYQEAKRLGT